MAKIDKLCSSNEFGSCLSVSWAHQGTLLTVVGRKRARRGFIKTIEWTVDSLRERSSVESAQPIKCCQTTDTGYLLAGDFTGGLFAYDLTSPSLPIWTGSTGAPINQLCASNMDIATAGKDGVKIWDARNEGPSLEFAPSTQADCWCVKLDGHVVHAGFDNSFLLAFDLRRPKSPLHVMKNESPVASIAIHSGTLWAGGVDGSVRVYSEGTRQSSWTWHEEKTVWALESTPKGVWAASGSGDVGLFVEGKLIANVNISDRPVIALSTPPTYQGLVACTTMDPTIQTCALA